MLFNSSGGNSFAMDIGSSAIRVVELKDPAKPVSQLLRYGLINVNQAPGYDPNSGLTEEQIVALIKQLLLSTGITNKNVIIGIETSKTFTTVADMLKTSKKSEQKKIIPVQAEEHLPSAMKDVDLDWKVIGDSPARQGKDEVLLVSVDKRSNEQRISIAQKAGLNVVAIEPDAFALPRSLVHSSEVAKNHIILETGNMDTDLIVTVGGSPRLVRTIPSGIQQIVTAASKNLNVDMAQAQQYVYKFGLDRSHLEGQVFNAIEKSVGSIISEATKTINFINSRYGDLSFQSILLSGSSSYLPGIDSYMQQVLQIPTVIANSWTNVSFPDSKKQELAAVNGSFAVAVGLARRGDDD